MKKWLAVLTAAAVGATLPQAAQAQGLGLGVKAGVNMANLSGDDVDAADMKAGLTVGAFATIDAGVISVQPELLFSQKGAQQDIPTGTTVVDGSWNTTYIDIPVLVRFGLPMPGSPMKPYLFAGPSAGFLLSSKLEAEADGTSVDVDIKEDTKSMDWSAVAGAGVEFGTISIDLRANFGLSSISDPADGSDPADVKNRTFSLMVGYRLPLGM